MSYKGMFDALDKYSEYYTKEEVDTYNSIISSKILFEVWTIIYPWTHLTKTSTLCLYLIYWEIDKHNICLTQ